MVLYGPAPSVGQNKQHSIGARFNFPPQVLFLFALKKRNSSQGRATEKQDYHQETGTIGLMVFLSIMLADCKV